MADENDNLTVTAYPDTSGDLVIKASQDGANVNISAVDEEGNEKSFGRLLVFEGEHGGHVEAVRRIIGSDLGLERENERMKISDG